MRWAILTAALVLLALAGGTRSQIVSISPSSQDVILPHGYVEIKVNISSVTGLYGFQFDISNDTDIWSFNWLKEDIFLNEGDLSNTFCNPPDTSSSRIIKNYACTRIVENSVSGDGNLTIINFTNDLQAGTTEFKLENVKLSDIDSMSIPVSAVFNATVTSRWCFDGETQSCGSHIGTCQEGIKTCSGGLWGSCEGGVGPTDEICDGLNNDCDTETDEDFPDKGDSCSSGIGECEQSGTMVCKSDFTGTECDATPGTPQEEKCPYTPEDEDCDGDDTEYMGDVNHTDSCDGCVDNFDLSFIGAHFGDTPENPSQLIWDEEGQYADLAPIGSPDGLIDIFDLVTVGANFGEEYEGATC